jgi:hypothetical protein
MNVFNEWTCIFPGKMGLSWKRAWNGVGTKEQAEEIALRNCNTVAVPLQLFETMKEHERRMVVAERALNSPANPAEIERLREKLELMADKGNYPRDTVFWTGTERVHPAAFAREALESTNAPQTQVPG